MKDDIFWLKVDQSGVERILPGPSPYPSPIVGHLLEERRRLCCLQPGSTFASLFHIFTLYFASLFHILWPALVPKPCFWRMWYTHSDDESRQVAFPTDSVGNGGGSRPHKSCPSYLCNLPPYISNHILQHIFSCPILVGKKHVLWSITSWWHRWEIRRDVNNFILGILLKTQKNNFFAFVSDISTCLNMFHPLV